MATYQREFRVVYYDDSKKPRYLYPENEANDNHEAMVRLLDEYVESGRATGGHIEVLIQFAGGKTEYVLALNEEEVL